MYESTAAISSSLSSVAVRRHQADRPLFPMQQHANGHSGRTDDRRRSGDVRRRSRLLAAVGAMATLADVLVDLLAGRKTLLVFGRQGRSSGSCSGLSGPSDAREHLGRAIGHLAGPGGERAAAQAPASTSATARRLAPAQRQVPWRPRAHQETRGCRLGLRDHLGTSGTVHSDRPHPDSASLASSHRAAPLPRRAAAPIAATPAVCFRMRGPAPPAPAHPLRHARSSPKAS